MLLRRYLSGEALLAMDQFIDSGRKPIPAVLRHRTILFVDLVGFTSLCESRDPEDVVQVLNSFFDAMVPVLVRSGASIDKFIGDAIMAVYEGEAQGARNAVAGALSVVEQVIPILQARLEVLLQVRIGINSGEVIVGDIGSREFRRDYTVIGDAVNVAQRIQSAAEVGEVLIGTSTYLLVRDVCDTGKPKMLSLKGKSSMEAAYPVLRIRGIIDET
jgi:class 3 adenylate cyclase